MCDPVTLGMGAMALGGTLFQGVEQASNQKRMAKASNEATLDNLRRIRGHQDEASEVFDAALPAAGRGEHEATRGRATESRTRAMADNASQPGSYSIPTSGSAPAVVQNEVARRSGQGREAAQRSGAARSRLSGYGDALAKTGIDLTRSRGQLGDISGAARGTAGLLPIEQSAAVNNANKGTSGFGQFLNLAGTVGGFANSAGMLDGIFQPAKFAGPSTVGAGGSAAARHAAIPPRYLG
jgi:hypothetical protein